LQYWHSALRVASAPQHAPENPCIGFDPTGLPFIDVASVTQNGRIVELLDGSVNHHRATPIGCTPVGPLDSSMRISCCALLVAWNTSVACGVELAASRTASLAKVSPTMRAMLRHRVNTWQGWKQGVVVVVGVFVGSPNYCIVFQVLADVPFDDAQRPFGDSPDAAATPTISEAYDAQAICCCKPCPPQLKACGLTCKCQQGIPRFSVITI
jgi:hypothetical protein